MKSNPVSSGFSVGNTARLFGKHSRHVADASQSLLGPHLVTKASWCRHSAPRARLLAYKEIIRHIVLARNAAGVLPREEITLDIG
jgi:hypothetical protein